MNIGVDSLLGCDVLTKDILPQLVVKSNNYFPLAEDSFSCHNPQP
jgi:hypothetical protein